ncbi:MAG: glutamate synthase subunit alpha, partial [Phycisphaerae bacterium]|nr:glutamate synthase subunit alpha [Phycisphaerae bacterium]
MTLKNQPYRPPLDYGLYEARREHDACGVGAVVNISGQRSHQILEYGREVIENLHHRGAAGGDDVTGDGAGILFQLDGNFFRPAAESAGASLPKDHPYGVGMIFLPRDKALREACGRHLAEAARQYGLSLLGWRDVPSDPSCLGALALRAEPCIRQVFIDGGGLEEEILDRKLYMVRHRAVKCAQQALGESAEDFYICSLSCRTVLYKGMFMAHQLFRYYPDLCDERMISALAVVHQRYSTNTFPNWRLAQPFRLIAHNGEINTLSGNALRMRARENRLAHENFGENVADLIPILQPGMSDSACFDAALELLLRGGRSLPHALMMMIPEAFGSAYHISTDKRAFYEYHSAI